MTSRKTSFFLYLMPSDLQETALVTVAGGRGAPVSSLCPSWVMYLGDKKVNTEAKMRKGEISGLRWRVPRKHQRRTENLLVKREDCLTYCCTQRTPGGKSRVGLQHIAFSHSPAKKFFSSFTVLLPVFASKLLQTQGNDRMILQNREKAVCNT